MTRQEQQQQRLEQAIAHVWMYDLEPLARLPRRKQDREVLRRARILAQSRKRMAWTGYGQRVPRKPPGRRSNAESGRAREYLTPAEIDVLITRRRESAVAIVSVTPWRS